MKNMLLKSKYRSLLFLPAIIAVTALIAVSCGGTPVRSEANNEYARVNAGPLKETFDKNTNGAKIVKRFPFFIYKDAYSKLNHFYPSGWMGDIEDMTYNDAWPNNPKSGKTCFRIRYTAKGSRGFGWAGLYWQDPINNWNVGQTAGGYCLTGAVKLKFYARGGKGGELIEFQVGGMTSETRSSGVVELTKDWKLFEIDLSGMNLTIVNGGFNAIYNRGNNPDGCDIYLDEIYFTDID